MAGTWLAWLLLVAAGPWFASATAQGISQLPRSLRDRPASRLAAGEAALQAAAALEATAAGAGGHVALPGALLGEHGLASKPTPPVEYDFFIIALFWPPSVVQPQAQARARHLVIRHEANAGFWTHGLWPVSHDVRILEYCSKEQLDPRSLEGFAPSLRFYLRSGDLRDDSAGDWDFYGHEWLRHGTCSSMDQLGYFLSLFHASALTDPAAALRRAGLQPSNTAPYTLAQVTAALQASFGDSFNLRIGLRCGPLPGRGAGAGQALQEVRLCVSKAADPGGGAAGAPAPFAPFNCSRYAEWVRPGLVLDGCGEDMAAAVWLPDYDDRGAVLPFSWDLLAIFGGAASLLVVLLWGGYLLLRRSGQLPAVFRPRQVQLVHYDLVHTPVRVLCEQLDMPRLWLQAPYIAEFVDDLPVGMGIKGGIARKLLKELYGTPEPPGAFDVDVLVFIEHYTHADRKAARELVTGMKLGPLQLEAKDVEVLTKLWLPEYFTSRDVTMNEVLVVKQAPGAAMFYYTRDALRDAQLQLIRPCVHTLKSEYNLNWQVEEDGTPFVSPSQLCRCLVRYLKGHGLDYALDASTWAHYRRERLNKMQLFKVLRPFHDSGVALQGAVDHLVEIGFLSRRDVLRAGGVNLLWGHLLQEVNASIAQAGSGNRLVLGELDADGVERWVDSKKAAVASKLISLEMRGRRTGFMPADEGVADLGLLHLPPALVQFIDSGPTFDLSGRLDTETNAALEQLSRSFTAPPPKSPGGAGGGPGAGAAPSAAIDAPAPAGKRVWVAQRSVAQASSDALISIARDSFTTPRGASPAARAALLSRSPQLAHMLSAEAATDGGGEQPHETSPQPARRRLDELESVKRLARERSNRAHSQGKGDRAAGRASPGGPPSPVPPAAAEQEPEQKQQQQEQGEEEPAEHPIWLRYSDVGRSWTVDEGRPEEAAATLGTFYQVLDSASALQDDARQYEELISDGERPQRKRLPLARLLRFALGVALLNLPLLAASYSLLLLGLVFRLAVPRVEGAIFDSFNALELSVFRRNLELAVGLVAADVAISFSGRVVLEVFARHTMSELFASFFDHILGQELTFFSKLSAGELMARTSGDSLTLRSMLTSTLYQLVEGVVLVMGSTGCLVFALWPLWLRAPVIGVALAVGFCLSGLEGFATGLAARVLNLRVRQSLGRMFGFSLDVWSHVDTVQAMGLEGRLLADYRLFARDYFRNTFRLNTLLVSHRAFTYALASAVRGAMLWFGGVAFFSDLTTVGTLFMMLRYVAWLQRGIKQASDAYARVMASVGSLERVVELHDRGVFRDAAQSLGREELPIVEDDEEEDEEDGNADGNGPPVLTASGAPGGIASSSLRQPLLRQWAGGARRRWWQWNRKPKVRVQLLPPHQRPDFGALLGGVRLEGVHLTLRCKTDRLVLADASLAVLAGEAAVITSEPGGGKSSLLLLANLRHMPFKGYIAFQLPASAVHASPLEELAAASARGAAFPAALPPPAVRAASRARGASGTVDASRGPGASLGYGYAAAPGGEGPGGSWVWAQFSFLLDDQKAARAAMALASVSAAGLFRTTVEDNVACAARFAVSIDAVRDACRRVGAHDAIMALPDGYRTLVGEGSGSAVSWRLLLQIAFARALVRRPRLLLLDDAEQFAAALGVRRLGGLLAELQAEGVAMLVATNGPPEQLRLAGLSCRVYRLEDGALHLVDGEEGGGQQQQQQHQ